MPVISPSDNSPRNDRSIPGREGLAALGSLWTPRHEPMAPEASAVIAAPPAWAARGMLYLLAGIVLIALLWARFSVLDVVVAGRGAFLPEGYSYPVQAVAGGRVKFVLAREGDRVRKGQVLLQLDRSEPRARLDRLREALRAKEAEAEQLRATGAALASVLNAQGEAGELRGEIAAAEAALRYTAVVAPEAGVVTHLQVRREGSVVAPGQEVAAVAPEAERLVAVARVRNRDIAFVQPGLPVKMKLDAFPFQDYGTVAGRVIEVAPDADADAEHGSVYRVTVAPVRDAITVNGTRLPFRPGLALTAEVVTERRNVLSFFLEPFRRLRAEAQSLK